MFLRSQPTGEQTYPRVKLVIPYFGNLPTYFPIFLQSCAFNPEFSFLLISDRRPNFSIPSNVFFVEMSLEEIRKRAEAELGFPVALRRPYKLCDFRPLYGVLFSELLHDCDYWGHCDLDVVFGNLRRVFPPEVYERYPKIQVAGHFSLYRNCAEMNHLFELPTPGIQLRRILGTPRNYAFDEWQGIWKILQYHQIPYYLEWKAVADVNPDRFRLKIHAKYDAKYQVFVWDRGQLSQYAVISGHVVRREFAYIHLQKRPMRVLSERAEEICSWMVTPRHFVPYQATGISPDEIRRANADNAWWNIARQVTRPYRRMRRHFREIVDTIREVGLRIRRNR